MERLYKKPSVSITIQECVMFLSARYVQLHYSCFFTKATINGKTGLPRWPDFLQLVLPGFLPLNPDHLTFQEKFILSALQYSLLSLHYFPFSSLPWGKFIPQNEN